MIYYFKKLNDHQRITFLVVIFIITCAFGTIPCIFFNLYGIPFGLLLGGGIGIANFWLLVNYSQRVIENCRKVNLQTTFNVLLRYGLYGLGLLIAAILTKCGYNIFNIFAVFGGYMITKIIVLFYYSKWPKEVSDNVS